MTRLKNCSSDYKSKEIKKKLFVEQQTIDTENPTQADGIAKKKEETLSARVIEQPEQSDR